MYLNRQQILANSQLRTEPVEVPEWGGTVLVSEMTGVARDAWEMSLVSKTEGGAPNVQNIRARLVAACVVDETGARLFTDADAAALGAKSATALERVAKVAQRLNGLTQEAAKEARGN